MITIGRSIDPDAPYVTPMDDETTRYDGLSEGLCGEVGDFMRYHA